MKQAQSCAALQLDNQLCFALHSTSLLMTKAYKPLLQSIGLTYPQYLAMLVLWEGDGITVGDIIIDRVAHRVKRSGKEIHLVPTEFRLLEFLMASPGRVFSRSQLLDGVWGHDIYVDERTVDVHVGRLRKALNFSNMQDVIRTVRGAGYSMEA